MHSRKEIVLLVVEDVVGHGDTWRHKLRDASLDKFLGKLRILKLVTDGHSLACPDKFRQIGIEGMIGKSCHGSVLLPIAVAPSCERYAKNARCLDSIVAISLVKVPTPEQQQGIWMFGL